jgi:hypothetical protein
MGNHFNHASFSRHKKIKVRLTIGGKNIFDKATKRM